MMKTRVARIICAIVMCVAIVACDGHMPRGILVEKEHRQAHTTFVYSPVTHHTHPIYHPQRWVFKVQCDSCGKVHSSVVDKATFDKYNVGDYVEGKGYYYGQESENDRQQPVSR